MDTYYGNSPPRQVKAEPSWGRDDPYGRRSPEDRRGRGGGGRQRSRSPPNIDRYQPTRQRDDSFRRGRDEPDRDRRRRSSPPPVHIDRYVPGQEPPTPVIMTNPLPNPMNLDFQVGFNWFAEWWRKEQQIKEERERQKTGARRVDRVKGDRESREDREKEREQIQVAYDQYKEKLQARMSKEFVQQHKGEEWFKERYIADVRDPFRQRLSEFRKGNYGKWETDLNSGVFDSFTLEGIYKNESNGAGGIVEKEEGETIAAAEVLGVGDLLPSSGGELRDEAILQPALLIKTIAPTVSRDKMEAFCKEHLGEGEGGFRWLSLSDPNPTKKYHRIGWVMLNEGGEPKVEERSDDREEDREDGMEADDRMIVADAGESKSVPEKALELINGKTIYDPERGDFTCHVGVHAPPLVTRKKALWDLFSAPERIDRDLQLVVRVTNKLDAELGEGFDGVTKVEKRVDEMQSKGWLQPSVSQTTSVKKERRSSDVEEGEDENMDDEEEEGAYDEEVDDEELLKKKKQLDLLVEYLRRVFNFCFFCVFESDSPHELTRKCPGGHLRRPRASLTSAAKAAARASAAGQPYPFKKQESKDDGEMAGSPVEEKKTFVKGGKNQQQLQRAFNWVKTFEDKIMQVLEPENVDVSKIGGRPLEEALDEELKKYVKQEDEAKFRCKVPDCVKLFKGENFWRKHVEKRHTEWYEKLQSELNLVNAYVLDPAHIAPSRSDANSNGHFPTNNNMPTGTPRGFNLANMGFGMPQMNMNGMPNAAGFPAFFANNPLASPGTWGQPGGFDMGDGQGGAGGPVRRQAGRFNSMNGRSNMPYDRQSKDQRNQRWNNNNGRLTPPRAGGRPGNPRFADGGAATVGPKEAIQGRNIKSYEDLDAVGGNGNGELNY